MLTLLQKVEGMARRVWSWRDRARDPAIISPSVATSPSNFDVKQSFAQ